MKIQYKLSLSMIALSLVLLLVIAGGFDFLNHHTAIKQSLVNNEQLAERGAHHIEVHLESSADIALTLASAPALRQALQVSNAEFDQFAPEERQIKIAALNSQWRATTDVLSPFIQVYMNNSAAQLLKKQQELLPGRYGEIFLTNRYGALLATTGKLSTLAHAHKYWWQASYSDGKGRIFIDDRGFDTSVQGYVLGIVVPVYEGQEVIGILKCNINIMGPLKHIVDQFAKQGSGVMKIARSNGLIVIAPETTPLSESLPENITPLLQKKMTASAHTDHLLVATAPVPVSLGSDKIGFGGSYKSVDHIKGNTGEVWHTVILIEEDTALIEAHKTTKIIIIAGLLLAFFITIASLIWGRLLSRPLARLTQAAHKIGQGDLETQVIEKDGDEISDLAHSLNEMAANLKTTMASRQELLHEVELRIQTEKELEHQATTDELTALFNRRAFSDHMKKEVERANRYDTPLCLLMFDIDYFKKVNDTYGHDVGDYVLVEVARVARNTVRDQDIVARWGGEEFMVILPHTQEQGGVQIAERLRQAIEEYDFAEPKHITVSVGVTERQPADSCDLLISRVDLALYEAKSAGRNRVEISR